MPRPPSPQDRALLQSLASKATTRAVVRQPASQTQTQTDGRSGQPTRTDRVGGHENSADTPIKIRTPATVSLRRTPPRVTIPGTPPCTHTRARSSTDLAHASVIVIAFLYSSTSLVKLAISASTFASFASSDDIGTEGGEIRVFLNGTGGELSTRNGTAGPRGTTPHLQRDNELSFTRLRARLFVRSGVLYTAGRAGKKRRCRRNMTS